MCGIAGIVGRVNDAHREALRRMACAMAHRGPDGEHFWTSTTDAAGNGCLLAHRRLSILDLSTAADQPMVDPVGGQCIVFNGEIYNYQQLRAEMQSAGQQFQSTGDTAVMLRALALEGHKAVSKLRGMFAFALWDDRARQLTLARDPLGIKPLYVCVNPERGGEWTLLFASEVRSILASGLIRSPRLDPAAVASVVWNGFVMGPGTAVRGIEQLWPGEARVFDSSPEAQRNGSPWSVAETYWRMPSGDGPKDLNESGLAEALQESVRLHLASDVPLGVFLSGGIDSGSVANLSQKASQTPVETFTLAFEEEQYNEGEFARAIAAAIGTRHREIVLTEDQFVSALEPAMNSLDQPTFDGLNSYYISKAVREAGLTVALVGTGGDELFGGYTSYRYLPPLLRWARRSRFLPAGLKASAARLASKMLSPSRGDVGPQTRWAKLPDMVGAGEDVIALYQLAYALFLPEFQDELLGDGVRSIGGSNFADGLPRVLRDRLIAETHSHPPLSAISVLEERCFLGERLLRDADAASMAVSLETRLPLVDQVLVEQVNRVPLEARYHPLGRKQMLRNAGLAGLDPKLFERPKSGFVLPFDRWIRRSLGKAMNDLMRDESAARSVGLNPAAVSRLWAAFQDEAPGMYWSRVWAIYVLMRWCGRYGVTL